MTGDAVDLRRAALDEWVGSIADAADAPDGIMADAGAELLADIALDSDQAGAEYAVERFRVLLAQWRDREGTEWERTTGAVRALMAVAEVIAARVPSQRAMTTVGAGTNAHQMLRELAGRPRASGRALAEALSVGLSEISRTGRRLLGEGCVTRTKAAQQALWEITPRGQEILELLDDVQAPDETSGSDLATLVAASVAAAASPAVVAASATVARAAARRAKKTDRDLVHFVDPVFASEIHRASETEFAFDVDPLTPWRPSVGVTIRYQNVVPAFDTGWRTPKWDPAVAWKHFHDDLAEARPQYEPHHQALRRTVLANTDIDYTAIHKHVRDWHTGIDRVREPVDRSRLLFYGLWTERFDTMLERLRLWGSLHDFAHGTPDFFVPDPRAHAKDVRATFGAMLQQFGVRADDVWPVASLPLWDGYAIVPGPDGVKGLVLFEAKSQPEELEVRLPAPRRDDRRRAFSAVVNKTARTVTEQSRRWHASRYADPVERLTLLRLLRERGVETWINNVYFVDPEGVYGALPPSEDVWTRHLGKAQRALDIGHEHVLARYVRDDFYVAPPVLAVGGWDDEPDEDDEP